MEVKIREMIGERCITKDAGQRIYDTIYSALKEGKSVTLDFEGVTQFASPFFNFAIGQLLQDISVKNLKDLVNIEKGHLGDVVKKYHLTTVCGCNKNFMPRQAKLDTPGILNHVMIHGINQLGDKKGRTS